jgi:SulP family sulfate permease
MLRLFSPMKLELQHWKGDLFGGLTTGIVALPLALAFGVSSGLEGGAAAGLYGAIILGFFAAIFGGTKPQVSGPTGPMTVVAGGFVASSEHPEYLFSAVVLGGVIQILFGVFKLGHYIRYVPRPVISGFLTGIGIIIFLLQMQPLMGSESVPGPLQAVAGLPAALANLNPASLGLGLLTVAIIYLLPRVSKAVPAALMALLVATVISETMSLQVNKIGDISVGLPSLRFILPTPGALPSILVLALTLAILGSLDTLLGSVVVDRITSTRHDSDKELVGQGIGNTMSGLFGGLPGAGATMRTLLNIRVGGRTGLSGVIHSCLLTGILLGLSKYAALIPLPVLAGILVTVGLGIIDYEALRMLPRSPRSDQVVLVLVLALTVFLDLITAVQMGFLLATLLFLQKLSDRELPVAGDLSSSVLEEPPAARELASAVQIIPVDGPVFFGTCEAFADAFEGQAPQLKALILRMTRVPVIDLSGAFALQEFVQRMNAHGVVVMFSGLPPEPQQVLRDLGVIPNTIPEDTVTATLAEAVEALNHKLGTDETNRLIPQPYLHKVGG